MNYSFSQLFVRIPCYFTKMIKLSNPPIFWITDFKLRLRKKYIKRVLICLRRQSYVDHDRSFFTVYLSHRNHNSHETSNTVETALKRLWRDRWIVLDLSNDVLNFRCYHRTNATTTITACLNSDQISRRDRRAVSTDFSRLTATSLYLQTVFTIRS